MNLFKIGYGEFLPSFFIRPVYERDAMIIKIQFLSVFKDGKLEIDLRWAIFAVDEKLPFHILLQKIKSCTFN